MVIHIVLHFADHISIILVTNGHQTRILYNKGQRNGFIVFLVLLKSQNIINKGNCSILTVVVHVSSFIFIQGILYGFLVNIILGIKVGLLRNNI